MRVRLERDPSLPCYVISVAASIVRVHPRTLRIYEEEGFVAPARTPTNIRLYSENDIRQVMWIRHLTRNRGVNLAGVKVLFELEEKLGRRILEALYSEDMAAEEEQTNEEGPTSEERDDGRRTARSRTAESRAHEPRAAATTSPLKESY